MRLGASADFGKIIRIDTKSVRSANRSISGDKFPDLDSDGRGTSAVLRRPPTNTEGSDFNPKPLLFSNDDS